MYVEMMMLINITVLQYCTYFLYTLCSLYCTVHKSKISYR